MDIVHEEVTTFCQSSSLKAVPRATRSNAFLLRVFWSVGAIGLFTFTCYEVYALSSAYLQYAVVTAAHEYASHPDGHMPLMPVVTLCVKHPIKTSVMTGSSQDHLAAYLKRANDLVQTADHLPEEQQRRTRELLMSTEGLFQTIGWQKASRMGFSVDDLIADCRLVQLLGMDTHTIPCGDHVTIQKRLSQRFLNCFDLAVKPSDLILEGGLILGLQLILYLENDLTLTNKHPFHFNDYRSGVLARISSQGFTSPSISIDSVDVPMGSDVSVTTRPLYRKRLSSPYGDCRNYTEQNGFQSQAKCLTSCYLKRVEEICGCDQPDTPFTNIDKKHNFCFNVSQPANDLYKNINCTSYAKQTGLRHCLKQCPQECNEILWARETKSYVWPSINSYKSFYEDVIKSKSYAHYFSYLDTYKFCSNNCSKSVGSVTRSIVNNFARFSYRISDYRFFEVKDVVKVSQTEMMSQIGGALNLWFGLTVVVVLEVFELCYRIAVRFLKRNKKEKERKGADASEIEAVELQS